MITADALFRLAANVAAMHYAAAPPYLAYHTVTTIDVPSLQRHKVVERAVETRTKDDYAALQDLPKGQHQYGQSFPLIPTFDALSYFRLDFNGVKRDLLAHVTMFQPITFTQTNSTANVVSTTLRNYYAQYANDSTDTKAHLVMDALPALTKGNDSSFYIHDVYIDTASNLPTRVTYLGKDDTEFTVDYTTVQNYWLVSHAFYAHTSYGPLRIGRVHFTADSTFDGFSFPATPADPKLAAPPSPAP